MLLSSSTSCQYCAGWYQSIDCTFLQYKPEELLNIWIAVALWIKAAKLIPNWSLRGYNLLLKVFRQDCSTRRALQGRRRKQRHTEQVGEWVSVPKRNTENAQRWGREYPQDYREETVLRKSTCTETFHLELRDNEEHYVWSTEVSCHDVNNFPKRQNRVIAISFTNSQICVGGPDKQILPSIGRGWGKTRSLERGPCLGVLSPEGADGQRRHDSWEQGQSQRAQKHQRQRWRDWNVYISLACLTVSAQGTSWKTLSLSNVAGDLSKAWLEQAISNYAPAKFCCF